MGTRVLRVNHPVFYEGMGLYLKSFGPDYTQLEASYDPGFWPAIAGAVMILAGAVLMLTVPPIRRDSLTLEGEVDGH